MEEIEEFSKRTFLTLSDLLVCVDSNGELGDDPRGLPEGETGKNEPEPGLDDTTEFIPKK